jgi:hypothetical protein
MTFDKLNRRVHLYGALVLLPWFIMYGVSSYPFAHPQRGQPKWDVRLERDYTLPPAQPGDDLDAIGAAIMRDVGMSGAFGAYRNPAGNLQVHCPRFLGPSRITYFEDKHRLVVEDMQFKFSSFLTGMHTRGGFERASGLSKLWAVVVDLFSLATVIWVASGIYMWWGLKRLHFWGWVALGGGLGSFLIFLLGL